MGDNEVERLKALALDLLCGNQQWMSFREIAVQLGNVGEAALQVALDGLVAEWKIWDDDCGGYHWAPPQEGESLADKVTRLEAENERLRARDAKLIADLKEVDAWTGDGDVDALDPLARRLWKQGVDAEGIEVNGAAHVARSALQDIERLEAENEILKRRDASMAEDFSEIADAIGEVKRQMDFDEDATLHDVLDSFRSTTSELHECIEENKRLRAEQAADRAAARALVEAMSKCWECSSAAATKCYEWADDETCDAHDAGFPPERGRDISYAAPLRALQALMVTWPSDDGRLDVEKTSPSHAEADATPGDRAIWSAWKRECAWRLFPESDREPAAACDYIVGVDWGSRPSESVIVRQAPDPVTGAPLYHIEQSTPHRYIGEFGDIDEPSVGDVEGYGVRR